MLVGHEHDQVSVKTCQARVTAVTRNIDNSQPIVDEKEVPQSMWRTESKVPDVREAIPDNCFVLGPYSLGLASLPRGCTDVPWDTARVQNRETRFCRKPVHTQR